MSSTNQSPQSPSADDSPVFEMPAYHTGDRCPQCQLGNKIAHLINKGQKLVCPDCWWNTKNRDYTVPTSNICANISCPNYDEEAEKIMQWCCKACEPAAVDDLPRQILPRPTAMECAKAYEAGQPMPPNRLLIAPVPRTILDPSVCSYTNSGGVFCEKSCLPGLEVCADHVDDGEDLLLECLHGIEAKDRPKCGVELSSNVGMPLHKTCQIPRPESGQFCKFCLRHDVVFEHESGDGTKCSSCGAESKYPWNHPVYQADGHPPQMDIGNGRTTKCPDYHLIPAIALQRIAERFELGEIRKGNKAWNADSPYQDVLTEKAFILVRLSHVIDHANKMMDEVRTGVLSDDDNAGAIGWAGCFLICVREKMKELQDASRKTTISEQPTTSLTGDADEVVARWLELVASNNTADPVHRAAAQQLYAHMYSPSKADQPVPPASDVVRSEG